MPFILHSSESEGQSLTGVLDDVDYRYSYPEGLNLRPGSELHKKIVDFVMRRARESHRVIQGRYDSWSQVEKTLTAFVSPDKLIEAKDDPKATVPVVIPMTYALLDTLITHLLSIFLADDVIFRYEGNGPEDVVGAILLEKIVAVHCRRFKVGLNLHTFFRDLLAYGFGAVSPGWGKKWGKKISMDEEIYTLSGKFSGRRRSVGTQDELLFEGNKLSNIDPRAALPDVNAPIHLPQECEYWGWCEATNLMSLLRREKNEDEDLFNVKYLKHVSGKSSIQHGARSDREEAVFDKSGGSYQRHSGTTKPIDVIWEYVDLIPEELGVGTSQYPERWLFGLGAEQIVICAKPLGLAHDMFPIVVGAPDYDGYSSTPIAKLEVTYGLQDTLDWLFTSHIANVRKAVNDMIVYDPSLIYSKDLRTPRPGKLIRLRKAAWGKGIEHAIQQLRITDITQAHIPDAGFISDMMQRVLGATETIQGIVRRGSERRSATEFRETKISALGRLERTARIISMQAMADIAYMFASHTQQLMEKDVYVKTVGDFESVLRDEYGIVDESIKVSPDNLMIDYDVLVGDGTSIGGEYVDSWIQIFQTLASNEGIGQSFDMIRIFKHIARITGAKNLNDFVRKGGGMEASVQMDESVAREAERGNLIPVEEANV